MSPAAPPFDAVLVLGKGLGSEPERALRELRARAAAASAAARAGVLPIYSLEARLKQQIRPGCEIMADLLLELGVPMARIRRRQLSYSTVDEALHMRQLAGVHGVQRVLVVTSAYHVARSRRLFHRIMGPERAAVHGSLGLLSMAEPEEREWILAGEPHQATLRGEGRVERLLTTAETLARPLSARLALHLESRAGRWLRRP